MPCFFAEHGIHERGQMPFCDGPLVKCHLIPQQVLKREVWKQRDKLRANGVELARKLDDLLWDDRVWVWGCGGIAGCDGHHGAFDHARTLRIPREALPPAIEQFAVALGLGWWLDREYGKPWL